MRFRFRLAAFAATFLTLGAGLAAAQHHGPLKVDHGWARQNLPGRPSAAYVTIHNTGDVDDRLIAASSPAFGRIELHTHKQSDGLMKMMRVESIDAPAGGMAALKPHGDHMMLFEPVAPIEKGGVLPLTLVFEQAGEITLELPVYGLGETPDAADMNGGMDHGDMNHGDMKDGGMDHTGHGAAQ